MSLTRHKSHIPPTAPNIMNTVYYIFIMYHVYIAGPHLTSLKQWTKQWFLVVSMTAAIKL